MNMILEPGGCCLLQVYVSQLPVGLEDLKRIFCVCTTLVRASSLCMYRIF
jgi:hypothetical protein